MIRLSKVLALVDIVYHYIGFHLARRAPQENEVAPVCELECIALRDRLKAPAVCLQAFVFLL